MSARARARPISRRSRTSWVPFFLVLFIRTVWECESYGGVILPVYASKVAGPGTNRIARRDDDGDRRRSREVDGGSGRAMSTVTIETPVERHPATTALTLGFKAAPIVTYITCELFSQDFIGNFVACVVALAMDFWVTKNISGRLLVGLRYWNEIDEEGNSTWRFESRDDEGMSRVSVAERRVFWTALYAGVGAWTVLLIGALASFEFNYALIPVVGLLLAASNLVGYLKCSKEAKEQLAGFARQQMTRAVFSSVTG